MGYFKKQKIIFYNKILFQTKKNQENQMNGNPYIQRIIQTEQTVNDRIKAEQAKKDKSIKEARLTGEQEIELYKQEQEAILEQKLVSIQTDNYADELNRQTQKEMGEINRCYQRNKNPVINLLIDRIMTVNLEIPQVLKGKMK
eukprot:TRINITY_DN694_c0_g1_i1.p2 TRINITY_DN694_c0_g1~~TRINITY_DN694_c0_g1_i1.p2  ORF type:complete len:143 (-),score=27.06 TRINITY_DN694_c0_g1_i1:116-544(-)